MSILVADDDPVIRRLFEKRLQDAGYTVQVAEDGMQAGSILAASHFDVVITDLVMPGDIGGIELLQIAKDKDPLTEVIVVTAHSSIDTAVSAMKKGAADYLEKPVNFDELFLRLEKINELRSLIRNADDLRNAMDVTESTAAQTIGDLELLVSDLQLKLDRVEEILKRREGNCEERIAESLSIIHE
jgi:DNA-binding NtrC family response regulator